MADNGNAITKIDLLALAWLRTQNLDGITPEEFYAKFAEAKARIKKAKEQPRPA